MHVLWHQRPNALLPVLVSYDMGQACACSGAGNTCMPPNSPRHATAVLKFALVWQSGPATGAMLVDSCGSVRLCACMLEAQLWRSR